MSRVSFGGASTSTAGSLAAISSSLLRGGAGAGGDPSSPGHAAEEDTAFIAESTTLLRNSTAQMRDPLFVPVQTIVDMMKANDEVRVHRMRQIQTSFEEVEACLRSYVHRHYDSFNDSIDYFSQLIRRIADAQRTVSTSHVDLSNVQGMLQCRALELEAHFRRAARSILVKRMLLSVVDCARAEGRVEELLRQRRFIAAAETVARARQTLAQPNLRGVQAGLVQLTTYARGAADHIKRSAFDFLLGVVFLRREVRDQRAMLAAIRRAAGSTTTADKSSSGSNTSGAAAAAGAASAASEYLADVSRDAPLFEAVRQAVGAFRDLNALRDVPKLLCSSAVACVESYFTAFVAAYAVYVRQDFSAEQILQARNSANLNNNIAGVSGGGTGVSIGGVGGPSSSASLLSGGSHLLTEERRALAEAQRPAVAAFFRCVLRQAAVMLHNLQRVVDIVLETELPFFRSSRAAAEVWKALLASGWAADSWDVEACTFYAGGTGAVDMTQRIMMSALRRITDDAAQIGGEVAATVDLAFGVSGTAPAAAAPAPSSSGRSASNRGAAAVAPPVAVPQWITAACNDPAHNDNFGALLRHLLDTTRTLCADVPPSTQNAVLGLMREHALSAARETVAGELRQLGASWDLTAVWDALQRMLITMGRVLCGAPAARSQKDEDAEKRQSELEMLKWQSVSDSDAAPGNSGTSAALAAAGSGTFQDEGRIGLEKLSYLLSRRDRGSGMPKYVADFDVVQVRLSVSAEYLIKPDLAADKDKNGGDGTPFTPLRMFGAANPAAAPLPPGSPASPGSPGSSGGVYDYVFPHVVASMESALNHTIVPVAGNARAVWRALEPLTGVVRSVLCVGRASVSLLFQDLGSVMSRQLLSQAHNFWMLRVAAVSQEEQKRVAAAQINEAHSQRNGGTGGAATSSPASRSKDGALPPPTRLMLVAATTTTQETPRAQRRPVLEIVDCAIRSIRLDFAPLVQRATSHGGLSTELALAVAERVTLLLETVTAAVSKKLADVCGGGAEASAPSATSAGGAASMCVSARGLDREPSSAWRELLASTVDTPLAVLAGAPELWEAALGDLRRSTQAAVASAPAAKLFLPLDCLAFVSTVAFSFELLCDTVETMLLAPLRAASAPSAVSASSPAQSGGRARPPPEAAATQQQAPPEVRKLQAVVDSQCRAVCHDALCALAAHVLGTALHRAAELRNDAVFVATTCSQRPSLFASELCNDLQSGFTVFYAHLAPMRALWLAALLAAPTAQMLLEEAVNVRDKRFSAAGVEQLVYDTLALEATVRALVVNPVVFGNNSSGGASSGSALGGGDDGNAANVVGAAAGGDDGGGGAAAMGDDDAATYLEMVSKPFRKPLDFFRLLRRSNDTERAQIVQDIIARRLHLRFTQAELETLVELALKGHKNNTPGSGLVEQHKARLRQYINSTYSGGGEGGAARGGGASSAGRGGLSMSSLMGRAAALFGTAQEVAEAAAPAAAAATAARPATPAAAKPTGTPDADRDSLAGEEVEDEEEEVEEEEEEEEEDPKKKKNAPSSSGSTLNRKNLEQTAKLAAAAAAAATPSAETNLSVARTAASVAAPSPVPAAPAPAPAKPPAPTNDSAMKKPSPAPSATHDHRDDDDGDDDGGEDEEFEEMEEFEEEEDDDEHGAAPPPPPVPPPPRGTTRTNTAAPAPASAPPPPAAAPQPGVRLSMREQLAALQKKP